MKSAQRNEKDTAQRNAVVLSPLQCKAARTMVSLGVRELAALAGVSPDTITRLERGETMRVVTVATVRAVLEEEGVEFVRTRRGEGVLLLKGGSDGGRPRPRIVRLKLS